MSTSRTGCFTEVLSLSPYVIPKGQGFYTTGTDKEAKAQRGDVPFQKVLY